MSTLRIDVGFLTLRPLCQGNVGTYKDSMEQYVVGYFSEMKHGRSLSTIYLDQQPLLYMYMAFMKIGCE